MTKNKRSKQNSTGRRKRAKESPLPSPGPSRTGPGPLLPVEGIATTAESVVRIEGDRTATNSRPGSPSPELLSSLAHEMRFISDNDPGILYVIDNSILRVWETISESAPGSLVPRDVFVRNAPRKQASGFFDLAKKATREKDWKDVILHGMLLALGMN